MRGRSASILFGLILLLVLQGCGAKETSVSPSPIPTPSSPSQGKEESPAPSEETPAPDSEPKEPDLEQEPAPEPELPGALGIMVENSWGARPHAGLDKADLVYELESEYGITRFLAYFYSRRAEKIGPIRSARMGFYEIAKAYNLPYGHAGGNPDVFDALHRDGQLPDLDEIYTCGNCFWRSNDRKAPHNLYTSTDLLTERVAARSIDPLPLYRFPEGNLPAGNPASSVRYSWGAETQDVSWQWDGRRYARSQSGLPHKMEDGALIYADNIVVIWTQYVWVHKGEWQHDVTIVGSGDGFLFRNGHVFPIRWQKASRQDHYQFFLAEGGQALMAPGQTWVSVLKNGQHLLFDP